MNFAVLNIRPDQTDNLQLVRLLNRRIEIALEALHSRIVLCAPRHADEPGYIGTAMLLDLRPDCNDQRYMVAELGEVKLFAQPVELRSAGQPYESDALDDAGNLLSTITLPASELCPSPNLTGLLRRDLATRPPAWRKNNRARPT